MKQNNICEAILLILIRHREITFYSMINVEKVFHYLKIEDQYERGLSMTKSLKERIKDLEEKYRIIGDNLLDAVFVVDASTLQFEYIPPSIERMSGYKADEYLDFSIWERLTPESAKNVKKILLEGCIFNFHLMLKQN